MFRVLIDQPQPEFWMVCSNHVCGVHCRSTIPLPIQNGADMQAAQATFLTACMKDGWIVNLEAQLCPRHAQTLKDAAKVAAAGLGGGQARVVRPNGKELVEINRTKVR